MQPLAGLSLTLISGLEITGHCAQPHELLCSARGADSLGALNSGRASHVHQPALDLFHVIARRHRRRKSMRRKIHDFD